MARKKKKASTVKKTTKKSTKKATKKSAKKPAGREMLLVASKTKEALKAYDINIAADALEGLNNWAYWLIEQAVKRAEANGRKTVRAHDFITI